MIICKLPVPFTTYKDMETVAKMVPLAHLHLYIDTTQAFYIDSWGEGEGIVLRCTVSDEPRYVLIGGKV